ncbi:low temperature requirement protein A [Streptomyces sp. NPDC059862]|uniref:low temperature requirement protein A n=1 Tax=Streptomyces sp. NPDC059862 TaxID=3346975 RepID=UPI0036675C5C
MVLPCAYLFVRCVHLVIYARPACDDRGLLRQIAVSWPSVVSGSALLITGAAIGGGWQTALYAAAIVVDWGGVYLTSRRGSWRIHSAAYFTERHQLFVIIAIGESLIAMAAGATDHPVTTALLAAGVLGVGAGAALWWLYFDVVSVLVEHRLDETRGQARLSLAVHAYGYAHFPIAAGIVLAALGVEGVVAYADSGKGLGGFYAGALCGGAATYLAGLLLFGRVSAGVWGPFRLTALCLLPAWLPAAVVLPPLAALAAVAVTETWWYAELRRSVRPDHGHVAG